jgi:hypothetical protein
LCFIPVPIIWKIRIPIRQKILVGLLLCSGLFIIAAAIIRCVLSIQNIRSIDTSGVWAIRETFVTIVAINAPCIKPLFHSSSPKNHQAAGYALKPRQRIGSDDYTPDDTDSATGSQVKMVLDSLEEEKDKEDVINVTTVVTVQTHPIDVAEPVSNDAQVFRVASNAKYTK